MVCCFSLSQLKQSFIKLPQKHVYAEITYLMIQTTIFTFINIGRIKLRNVVLFKQNITKLFC